MKKKILQFGLILIALIAFQNTSFGQGSVSNLAIEDDYQHYTDSLKNTEYPWHFPIMGSKLRKMGFDLPFPNGLMINYAYSKQDLMVSNLNVGLSPTKLMNVDGFARFNNITPHVQAVSARYDFWLLPFLNVYGIGGYIKSETEVSLGLPFKADFTARSEGPSVGWGTVVAGGVGPLVVSLDYTQVYTFTGSTDKATRTNVIGARIGHMFRFRKKPYRNVVALVGVQYLGLNKSSGGKVDIEKLVGITPEGKIRASQNLDTWYGQLNPTEQQILEPVYQGASNYLNSTDPLNLHYTFDKALYYPWSMSLGINYQHNKRYQFTALYSFLGSRNQIVFGLNYRFGFKGKNFLKGVTL
ncbi:hypothetical protein MY04_1599 [Flammeovirga sp. MY04]|uniref:hypothetical protein n=1 Tax=Flammeovirga sp. MY04 TaxID=1191459 RepID=UPI000806222B|nr:hypothetical protein [Flammeovirga sp. MY04]ANQ48973.1 hypothetical protein MY04_1599 [Flammeovirga sp. MY04]